MINFCLKINLYQFYSFATSCAMFEVQFQPQLQQQFVTQQQQQQQQQQLVTGQVQQVNDGNSFQRVLLGGGTAQQAAFLQTTPQPAFQQTPAVPTGQQQVVASTTQPTAPAGTPQPNFQSFPARATPAIRVRPVGEPTAAPSKIELPFNAEAKRSLVPADCSLVP